MSAKIDSSLRDSASVLLPSLLLVVLGFFLAYQFVDPAPPARFVMSTGSADGTYHAVATRYKDILARHGVEMELRESAGSIQNLQRLSDAADPVQVAFVQGGTSLPQDDDAPELESLGSLYFEPLWVFHARSLPVQRLTDLRGRRIAVGAKGSGTQAIALELLAANGITAGDATLADLAGSAAADALRAGEMDALFMVGTTRSAVLRELLRSEELTLLSFERAEAYTRTRRFMSAVTLPQGIVDLVADRPPADVTLLAPTANLVVRADFHPALVDLLMAAAHEVHRDGGLFEEQGQFPSPNYVDRPLNEEARRYYESGPTFLRRVLPFWAATLVERMLVLLLPLVALLIPLMRLMPPVYRWRIRSRIYRWYKELLSIDPGVHGEPDPQRARRARHELMRIEDEVGKVQVPLSYADQLYALRMHIELVRQKLDDSRENGT